MSTFAFTARSILKGMDLEGCVYAIHLPAILFLIRLKDGPCIPRYDAM